MLNSLLGWQVLGLLGGQASAPVVSPPDTPASLSMGAVNGIVSTQTPTYSAAVVEGATSYTFLRNTSATEVGAQSFVFTPTGGDTSPHYTELSNLALDTYYVAIYATGAGGDSALSDWISAEIILSVTPSVTFSAELLTNGDFSDGTGTFPNGWTKHEGTGDTITESAADGSAGTESAKFVSDTANDPRMEQTVRTANHFYQDTVNMTQRTSGKLNIPGVPQMTLELVKNHRNLTRASGSGIYDASTQFGLITSVAPASFVIDDASEKEVIYETFAALADGYGVQSYTIPASPIAGDRISVLFRYTDAQNYWSADVFRRLSSTTSWDYELVKVTGGTRTTPKTATNVGATDAIRLTLSGNDITVETGASGVFTQRGTTLTDSTGASATGWGLMHTEGFTASLLKVGSSLAAVGGYDGSTLGWFVDPSSMATPDGSVSAPFTDVKVALENSALASGHVVNLQAGAIPVDGVTINVVADGITIKPYDGEYYEFQYDNAGKINIYGDGVIVLELANRGINSSRISAQTGSNPTDIERSSFSVFGLNCVIQHRYTLDMIGSGVGLWDCSGTRLTGGITKDNGWKYHEDQGDEERHGHSIYTQHDPGGADIVINGGIILADPMNEGLRIGGSEAAGNSDYDINTVCVINKGIYGIWSNNAVDVKVTNLYGFNAGFDNTHSASGLSHEVTIDDSIIDGYAYPILLKDVLTGLASSGNVIGERTGGDVWKSQDTDAEIAANYSSDNNAFYSTAGAPTFNTVDGGSRTLAAHQSATGQEASSTATASRIPDAFICIGVPDYPGRGTVMIYNGVAQAASVTGSVANLNLTNGVEYIARQAQDPLSDTFTFTYLSGAGADNGDGTVTFPMTGHTVRTPLGLTAVYGSTADDDVVAWYVERNL